MLAFYMFDQLLADWSSSFEYQIFPLTGVATLNARLLSFHYDESYLIRLGFHSCWESSGAYVVIVTLHCIPCDKLL